MPATPRKRRTRSHRSPPPRRGSGSRRRRAARRRRPARTARISARGVRGAWLAFHCQREARTAFADATQRATETAPGSTDGRCRPVAAPGARAQGASQALKMSTGSRRATSALAAAAAGLGAARSNSGGSSWLGPGRCHWDPEISGSGHQRRGARRPQACFRAANAGPARRPRPGRSPRCCRHTDPLRARTPAGLRLSHRTR